jgi:DNA-binding CsgD family transcriptional regulator
MALSGQSQLAMLAERDDEAIALGTRAVELARARDDAETEAHALTNVGTALMRRVDQERGRAVLEEAFVLAAGSGQDDHAARALVNLATGTLVLFRDDPRVVEDLERALTYARERELDGYVQYLLGVRANLQLLVGRWAEAEADARASLNFGEQRGVSLCPAYIVLGRLRARRGEPGAGETLDLAWRLATSSGELQRIGPAAAARAEYRWLNDDAAGTVAAAREAYALAAEHDDAWAMGELAAWLWRAGEPVPPRNGLPAPYARALAGDWRGAADAWARLGFPYERAQALADADEDAARLEALSVFDAQGAARAASHLRKRLRAAGVRRIPRGPRPASRTGPAGLTPRETQVLELIVGGSTNAEIARELVITPKTVDHHVSAVLAKLGVASRRDAGAALARLEATG